MKYGIDVSHYQNNIDWSRVKATGKVEFAIMKAMYESTKNVDETFERNYAGCTNYGINRGVYNFIGSISASDPVADAKAFLKILDGRKLEFGIWLDVESKNLRSLGKERIEDVILTESDIFSAAGYSVGIYCNLDWYKNVITDRVKDIFDGRFWIARYPKNDKGEVVNNLSPKNSCPESIGWQYSSKGKVDGISGVVDMDMFWGELKNEMPKELYTRAVIVENCEKFVGAVEGSNGHLEVLNIYNGNKPLPRGYAVKPSDAWCATFASAMYILAGYQDIFPIECGCEKMIAKAREMGIWIENDSFVPQIADAVLYDWQDNGVGDDTGAADHVGIVTYVNKDAGYMVVTEGNYSDSVKKRTINLNGKYIRGFITPKFTTDGIEIPVESKKSVDTIAHEVIAGQWGKGEIRKEKLTNAGYNYSEVQARVNEILNTPKKVEGSTKEVIATSKASKIDKGLAGEYTTTADLYCRDGAGTNKKALVCIPKGTKVQNFGYYSVANGVNWLYITFNLNGIKYTGFSSSVYLRR